MRTKQIPVLWCAVFSARAVGNQMPVASYGLLREVDFVGKVGLGLDPVELRVWIKFSKRNREPEQ